MQLRYIKTMTSDKLNKNVWLSEIRKDLGEMFNTVFDILSVHALITVHPLFY